MFTFAMSMAVAAPPAPVLPAEEERLELESLEQLRLETNAVPAWPDMRPFRRRATDGLLAGLAVGTVSGILVASLVPDRVLLRGMLSSCERRGQVLIGCS